MNKPLLEVSCDADLRTLRLQCDERLFANWTVLFGASGSGKSSLLRLIAGLWNPPGSTVVVRVEHSSRVPAHRRRIGFVAQQPALFPHLNVRNNVAFGCKMHPGQHNIVPEVLEAFGLARFAQSLPASLSGGEQQRVAIARAIAATPRFLLLDEAFTGMHRTQQEELIGVVRKYSRKLDMPLLSVTHDVAEAFLCADEVLRMESGRITERGAPAQVLASERAALLRRLGAA